MALTTTGLGSRGVVVDVNRTPLYTNSYNNTDAFISSLTLSNVATITISGTIEFFRNSDSDYYYLIRGVTIPPYTTFVYDYDISLDYQDTLYVTASASGLHATCGIMQLVTS